MSKVVLTTVSFLCFFRNVTITMDQDRLLALFLHVIHHFVQWISVARHCLFVIELGFQQPTHFHSNVGPDLIHKVYVACCSNSLHDFEEVSDGTIIEKPFMLHEKVYRYNMTPFDVRYRVFHLSEHVDNKYRYVLKPGDNYFFTVHNIIVFFNTSTGHLGLACDIEKARKDSLQISDFYLIHQCCLILNDICTMIEDTICPIECSIVPLT